MFKSLLALALTGVISAAPTGSNILPTEYCGRDAQHNIQVCASDKYCAFSPSALSGGFCVTEEESTRLGPFVCSPGRIPCPRNLECKKHFNPFDPFAKVTGYYCAEA